MSQELQKAKQAMVEMEEALKSDRRQLRDLTAKQSSAEKEKENIAVQLRRAEAVSLTTYSLIL